MLGCEEQYRPVEAGSVRFFVVSSNSTAGTCSVGYSSTTVVGDLWLLLVWEVKYHKRVWRVGEPPEVGGRSERLGSCHFVTVEVDAVGMRRVGQRDFVRRRELVVASDISCVRCR
eukprot:3441189-Prymnesium_polylepis.2